MISSSQVKVDRAVQRLKSSDVKGHTADARDEAGLVDVLLSLAPVDHIIYSGVDKIIRGKLENLELDEAKHLFDVKFWGAVIVGKGMEDRTSMRIANTASRPQAQHHPDRRLSDLNVWHGRHQTWQRSCSWWRLKRRRHIPDEGACRRSS